MWWASSSNFCKDGTYRKSENVWRCALALKITLGPYVCCPTKPYTINLRQSARPSKIAFQVGNALCTAIVHKMWEWFTSTYLLLQIKLVSGCKKVRCTRFYSCCQEMNSGHTGTSKKISYAVADPVPHITVLLKSQVLLCDNTHLAGNNCGKATPAHH